MSNTPGESSGIVADRIEAQGNTPDWAKNYISQDPRLAKLMQDPAKMQEILAILEKDKAVFEKIDNKAEQTKLLSEGIKEYGVITSDGREFGKLNQSEIDALSRSDKKLFYSWKENKIDEKIDKEDDNLKSIKDKLQSITKEVDSIVSTFSEKDKTLLSTSLSDAKSGKSDNAAVEELKRQGVNQADIESGKYDSYISASIIISSANKFEATKNPDFQASLKRLQSLGIPANVQGDFQSANTHITERFASGSRTDTAVATMRTSLASGQFQGIHYDGIGERYTLIGKDGKTRKDIYMDKPPRASVRMNGLTIDRDIPPITEADKKRGSLEDMLSANYERAKKIEIVPAPSKDDIEKQKIERLYSATLDRKNPVEARANSLKELRDVNSSRKAGNFKDMMDKGIDPEPVNSQLEKELQGLDALEKLYMEERAIFEQTKALPSSKSDDFDSRAQTTLEALTGMGYDELGQGNLEKLISGLKLRDGNKGIWESGIFDMNDTVTRDKQLRELREFADLLRQKSGKSRAETLQDIRNGIAKNEAFRNIWNKPENLARWIQEQTIGDKPQNGKAS